jgi:hypothetical protein
VTGDELFIATDIWSAHTNCTAIGRETAVSL